MGNIVLIFGITFLYTVPDNAGAGYFSNSVIMLLSVPSISFILSEKYKFSPVLHL